MFMKKVFRLLGFPLAIATVFILARCNEKATEGAATESAIPVKVQPVAVSRYTPVLKYSGTMASTSEARLSFKINGIISRTYVKEGDHVTKGQLLATLDLTEINAQVQQGSQNLEKAKR